MRSLLGILIGTGVAFGFGLVLKSFIGPEPGGVYAVMAVTGVMSFVVTWLALDVLGA